MATEKLDSFIEQNYKIEIKAFADVFVDDYAEGELEQVNYFTFVTVENTANKDELSQTLQEMLNNYFENELLLDEDVDLAEVLQTYWYDSAFYVNRFVDVTNDTPSEDQIEAWKSGEETLYNQSINVCISINGTPITSEILADVLELEIA
jgi:hypothetical protein